MTIEFFVTDAGGDIVLDEVYDIDARHRGFAAAFENAICDFDVGLRAPKPLGDGFWELKISLKTNTYRAYFSYESGADGAGRIALFLHVSQKTTNGVDRAARKVIEHRRSLHRRG